MLLTVLVQWVTHSERKQETFTIPHFKYGDKRRFAFNWPCLCKRIKRPQRQPALLLRRRRQTVDLLKERTCGGSSSPCASCRQALCVPPAAERARRSDAFDIYCCFCASLGSTQAEVFFLLSFSSNSLLGSWHFFAGRHKVFEYLSVTNCLLLGKSYLNVDFICWTN